MIEMIEWNGGPCPVDFMSKVRCQKRNGEIFTGDASLFSWDHKNVGSDIVAYGLVSTPMDMETKLSFEELMLLVGIVGCEMDIIRKEAASAFRNGLFEHGEPLLTDLEQLGNIGAKLTRMAKGGVK